MARKNHRRSKDHRASPHRKPGVAGRLSAGRMREELGQAMAEYSTISYVLLAGTLGVAWPFFRNMIDAMNQYYEGIYYTLNLPLP